LDGGAMDFSAVDLVGGATDFDATMDGEATDFSAVDGVGGATDISATGGVAAVECGDGEVIANPPIP